MPGTGLIDLEQAEAAITPRTKAIMPVHLAGRPVDMDRLGRLRDKYGLQVIEDAAHALGAAVGGRKIGAFGNLTAFSFYVTKNVTTIEGGALVTGDPALAGRVERLALHGLSLGAWQRFSDAGFKHYEVVEPGFKYNMTDVQAALGLHQLPRLDAWIERRAELWARYDASLADLPVTTPPPAEPNMTHARHLYQVTVVVTPHSPRPAARRASARRIGTGVHYRGVHLHPFYRERYCCRPGEFPVATAISESHAEPAAQPQGDRRRPGRRRDGPDGAAADEHLRLSARRFGGRPPGWATPTARARSPSRCGSPARSS